MSPLPSLPGLLLCFALAILAQRLGQLVPLVGGAVFGILLGMLLSPLAKRSPIWKDGLRFASKKVLQGAVILLGFGLNLSVVLQTGWESLPIILSTISTSLLIAWLLWRITPVSGNTAVLVGVGSSICGGSAIAAVAPVVEADEHEVAQAVSVVFLFNVIAALCFPALGQALGFSGSEGFGLFVGTAVNDTSSVTATASVWDSLYGLGTATLDRAVTVKLTRTLAILPITLCLALLRAKRSQDGKARKVSLWKIFPRFILYFLLASCVTTAATACGISADVFAPCKTLSKFMIVMAMTAIGLNTDVPKLIKSGRLAIALGFCCWSGITVVSLTLQKLLGLF